MNEYDIRVVRMAKATAETTLATIATKMNELEARRNVRKGHLNMCFCLGHFDVMMIERLEPDIKTLGKPIKQVGIDYNKAWDLRRMLDFNAIPSRYSREENYYYPIYMLLQYDKSSKTQKIGVELFWWQKTNFTVVSRIHQDIDSIIQRNERFQIILKQRLKEACLDTGNNDVFPRVSEIDDAYFELEVIRKDELGVAVKNKVCCIFYDSLELGDVVCIAKSDSLSAILEVQRWLYESPDVNDSYSYCGIHYLNFIGATEFPQNSTKLKRNHIEYVETRFSVENPDYAWHYLDSYSDKGYFVTGNADALLHYNNLSECEFIEKMKQLVSYDKIHESFTEVVTRVGMRNRAPIRPNGYQPRKAVNADARIELKEKTFAWLVEKFNEINHPDGDIYVHSLTKLISTLNTMYNNSVLDALSRMMHDGISALVQRLEYCCDHNLWEREYSYELQEFLDQWTAATNAILHLESQLFQHPELVPVRYYIPAMILQFEQLIVDKGMEALSMLDKGIAAKYKINSNPQSRFVPIILPLSKSSTTTKAILDPKGSPEYNAQTPLQIFLPIHMLYHPWRMSHILCHEIAHYCGQNTRWREKRNQHLINSVAYYITSLMVAKMDIAGFVSDISKQKIALKLSSETIERYIKAFLQRGYNSPYINDIVDEIKEYLPLMLSRPEVTNDVIRFNIAQIDSAEQHLAAAGVGIENYFVCEEIVTQTREHLEYCLRDLYSECFADVIMVLLTQCSFHDYYTSIFDDEYENLKRGLSEKALQQDENALLYFEHYTDRIALVSACIASLPLYSNWITNDKIAMAEWQIVALKKIALWENSKKNTANISKWHKEYQYSQNHAIALLGEEANHLLEYLKICATNISEVINDASQPEGIIQSVLELRTRIKLLSPDHMDWNELQNILMLSMK